MNGLALIGVLASETTRPLATLVAVRGLGV
jgi:hypothetical protein